MIVIGVDVHKQSVTAVAVDEAGRMLDERTGAVGRDEVGGWASELGDERRRTQQRLRWHLHQLDPTFAVPLRMLGRPSHLERVTRWLARQEQELQVRLARELVARCRALTRTITELDRELEQRTAETAP